MMQAKRHCSGIFKAVKEKQSQPKLLYPAKISFKNERGIKAFQEEQKLREFIASTHELKENESFSGWSDIMSNRNQDPYKK